MNRKCAGDTEQEIIIDNEPEEELVEIRPKNIALHERDIYIEGDIDDACLSDFRYKIRALETINKNTITVWINSAGGSCLSGLGIIDLIQASSCPIVTVVNGQACSMAFLIAISADVRLCTKHSWFMAHQLSTGPRGSLNEVLDSVSFASRLEVMMDSILKRNTKLSDGQWKKAHAGELWLDAKQSLKACVIDKIIESRTPVSFSRIKRKI